MPSAASKTSRGGGRFVGGVKIRSAPVVAPEALFTAAAALLDRLFRTETTNGNVRTKTSTPTPSDHEL